MSSRRSMYARCSALAHLALFACLARGRSKATNTERFFAIANAGRDFTVNGVKPEDWWSSKSPPDITMGGERWEVKCPSGTNKKRTIFRNINKAVFQMKNANPPAKKINIVISSPETELSMDEINYQVDKRIGRGEIDAILVIGKDGKLEMYTKK